MTQVTSYSNKGNSIPGFDPSIYTTKNLPSDDVIKLKECFDIFDYSKNGTVSAEELSTAITALGL
jgi:Ca2+-binding EF-hand superfamily protein